MITNVALRWKHSTMRMCGKARQSVCVFVMSTANMGLTTQSVTAVETQLNSLRCGMAIYRMCTWTQKVCMLESISCWKVLTSPSLTVRIDTTILSLLFIPRVQQKRWHKAWFACSCTCSFAYIVKLTEKACAAVKHSWTKSTYLAGAFAFLSML